MIEKSEEEKIIAHINHLMKEASNKSDELDGITIGITSDIGIISDVHELWECKIHLINRGGL